MEKLDLLANELFDTAIINLNSDMISHQIGYIIGKLLLVI